jgi:glycolate oxidase FAD binding subunit
MPFAELQRTLEGRGQMLPLDPFTGPGWENATVGGVIGANLSGPRRRLYGTARDMVIGMTFATLEGKLVQTGGMVVKNVAGLDMGKLMIGSFGTLAAITSVNFKVFPIPPFSRTFVMEFSAAGDAFAERDRILRGQLPPAAIDIVTGSGNYRLLVRATGNGQVVERFSKDLAKARAAEGDEEAALWQGIREFTPRFLAANPQGGVVAVRTPLVEMREALERLNVPCIARAGSGVIYAHYATDAPPTPVHDESGMMKKIKHMFDPENLLNRGRLHGYV